MLDKTKVKDDRIQFRLREAEAKRIKEYCEKEGIKLSQFMRNAAIEYLERKDK